MNRFWSRGSILAVLVLAAVAAYVLLPVEIKQITESKDERPQPKVAKSRPKLSADIIQIPTAEPGQGFCYPDEKVAVKYPDNLQPGQQVTLSRNQPPWSKEQPTLADRRIRSQYLDIEAERTRQQSDQKRDVDAGEEIIRQYLNILRTKQLDGQTRPDLPEGSEFKLTDEQIERMHEEAVEAVLEQYKDNPKQAEQVKEFLLERLEYHQKLRKPTKTKTE